MKLKKHKTQKMPIFTLALNLLLGTFYHSGTLLAEIKIAAGMSIALPQEVVDLHKTLCQVAKDNKQHGKNILVFRTPDGGNHILLSGRKNIIKILKENQQTTGDYMDFVAKILGEEFTCYHGSNNYFHTEMLLAYAIINNLTIDNVACQSLLSRNLDICSYKDMCPNCEKILKYLSVLIYGRFIVSSLKPYKFGDTATVNLVTRNSENEQFRNPIISDNFLKIAFYDKPELPLPIDWDLFAKLQEIPQTQ
jgi:hypothetical protein